MGSNPGAGKDFSYLISINLYLHRTVQNKMAGYVKMWIAALELSHVVHVGLKYNKMVWALLG